MRFTASLRWPATLALAALAAACNTAPPVADTASAPPRPPEPSMAVIPAAHPAPIPDLEKILHGYYWDLQNVNTPPGVAPATWQLPGHPPLRLQFHGQQMAVQNLCNVMNARYRIVNEKRIFTLERPVSTLRACPEQALMQLERQVATALPAVRRFHLSPPVNTRSGPEAPKLMLEFDNRMAWIFVGVPTPATRFGNTGERIFLEVEPQPVACRIPGRPDPQGASCLRVREVHYDAGGIRRGTGEWRTLHEPIEGYTHQRGVRTVLRLQRYPITDGRPTDPRVAYVLDMVVEQSREGR